MQRLLNTSLLSVLALGLAAVPSFAAGEKPAKVFVVHGIRGQDLGADPALPVDVEINGDVALAGFEFGTVVGPLELPAGTYQIDISLANETDPGSNDSVISAAVPFVAGECATVIAHLDAGGDPTASKFVNDLRGLGFFQSRLLIHHTAAAPAVDIDLKRLGFFIQDGAFVPGVVNGQQGQLDLFFGFYRYAILAGGAPVLGPGKAFFLPKTAYLVYVVGSAENDTLTFIAKRLFLGF